MNFVRLNNGLELSFLRAGHCPENEAIFLHGIMGSKKNWQGFLKLFVEACPTWSAYAFDLRNHGESSKHQAPFTVEAAAADIKEACAHMGIEPKAMIGHSFGAKVALRAAFMLPKIEHLWLLDSSLSALPQGTPPLKTASSTTAIELLEILREIDWPMESRRALIESLRAHNVTNDIALWMTTNLEAKNEGFWLNFEPSELEAMLRDFLALDLWSSIPELALRMDIHLVAAEYGYRVGQEDQKNLSRLAKERGYFHPLKSGHFVQTDNPDGLIDIMKPYFNYF